MTIRIDRARLLRERRRRGWSQEQLAMVSGISPRTVQRLEQGKAAAPASLAALAFALAMPLSALALPEGNVRRITPLAIVRDLGPARDFYQALGLSVIETEDPGCVGLRAGATSLILCTVDFLRDDFRAANIEQIVGRTVPYVWVHSLEEARKGAPKVIEEVSTRAGTREILVEESGLWAILAETIQRSGPG